MSKIFSQTFADLGVAADTNYMNGPDRCQASLSIIKLKRNSFLIDEISKIGIKLKGQTTVREFTDKSQISAIYSGAQFDTTADNAVVKDFLDKNVHNTIPKDKNAVNTAKDNFLTSASLDKFLKMTASKSDPNELCLFTQGAATSNTSSTVDVGTMVEAVTIEITAANDSAKIDGSKFIPCTNFDAASTARLGGEISL